LLLSFDAAGIQGNPAQVALNLQMAVNCQSWNVKCTRTVKFAFPLPFHASSRVITPHQAVTMNGKTFTLERVVITLSEARVYIGGWSEAMFKSPSWDQKPQPQSYDETWYNIQLSVKGKTRDLCTLLDPLNCPHGAQISPAVPVNPLVSFGGGGDINPVYLNNDHTILGFSLLEPVNERGNTTVTITKKIINFVKNKKNNGSYVGITNEPVDDKSASPWVFTFTLP
jgi:hypothetical protein